MNANPKSQQALLDALSIVFSMTVAKRIVCAVLLAFGVSEKEAAEFAQVCQKSAHKYKLIINGDDASALLRISCGGHPCKLASVKDLILAEVDRGMYRTLRQIRLMVKQTFGIEISRARICAFLSVNGYRLLRCASLPAKADFAKQREFYKDELLRLMAAAKRNELTLQFMDAAHFVYGLPNPGAVYTKARRAVKTASGRMRHNVLASLDFISKQITTVTNDTYIRAAQVIDMFEKLAAQYTGKPIVVVLDNAKYQRCSAVQECADRLKIALCYLPTYSPNLNLIERFWKHIKSEVLNAAYMNSFDEFVQSITDGIRDSFILHKDNLDSLISYKVQLYDDRGYHLSTDDFFPPIAS